MSTLKRKANLDDGCIPELVAEARFDGTLEIPFVEAPKHLWIPDGITPFTERDRSIGSNEAIGLFEKDPQFADILIRPEAYITDLQRFAGMVAVDCSLYRDAPLAVQLTNLYRNRALESYFQRNGCNVIPLIRWGNELTFTTRYFPEKIAFLGIEKKSIVCVGTYGCMITREDKYYFKAGLDAMMETLEPQVVLVYEAMPDKVFGEYLPYARFVHYDDWTTRMHKGGDR